MPRDSDSGVGRRLRRGTVVRHLRLRGCWMLSPSSGIHPLRKTSTCTCSFPVAALDMTAPP
jgi:hypothetical protein